MNTNTDFFRVVTLSLLVAVVSGNTVSWAGEPRAVRDGARTDTYAMGRRPQSQTKAYRCPRCGMTYDKPGVCPMDNAPLVKVTPGASKAG